MVIILIFEGWLIAPTHLKYFRYDDHDDQYDDKYNNTGKLSPALLTWTFLQDYIYPYDGNGMG